MKANIIIRMGATHWGAQVRKGDQWVYFDFRKMTKRERADWHREFMNAFRTMQKEAA